jgi:hypothetical protein
MALKKPAGRLSSPRGSLHEIKQLTLLFFIKGQFCGYLKAAGPIYDCLTWPVHDANKVGLHKIGALCP